MHKIKTTYVIDFAGPVMSKKNHLRYSIRMTKTGKSFVHKHYTPEYDQWEKWLPLWARANLFKRYGRDIDIPFKEEFAILLELWPKSRHADTVNGMAGIADGLEYKKLKKENGLYFNDRQIVDDRTIFMGVDKENPRFRVTIKLIDDGQRRLF